MSFNHDAQRALQTQIECTALADRLEQVLHHTTLTDDDRTFIEGCSIFFLTTAITEGRPGCSYNPIVVRYVNNVLAQPQ